MLVNVWASWCLPCRDEAPALEAFYREHKDQNQGPDLEVLGVDTQGDNAEEALAFVDEFELSYPQLHDGAGDYAEEALNTTGVPESFLVAPDGTLARRDPPGMHQGLAPRRGRTQDRGELMRRLLAIAITAALALLAAAPASAQEPQTSLADIEDEVMCVVCEESRSTRDRGASRRSRNASSSASWSPRDSPRMRSRTGSSRSSAPRCSRCRTSGFDLVAWLVPGLGIIVAAGAIFVGLRRWREDGADDEDGANDEDDGHGPDDHGGTNGAVSAEDAARLERDLARYDL